MGGEQHPQRRLAGQGRQRGIVRPAHPGGGGGDVAGIRVVAAQGRHRRGQVRPRRRFPPSGERRPGRGGGELRVKRQQHDLIRAPCPHRLRHHVAERVPVAHRHEALHVQLGQGRLQRAGLLLRQAQQGRATAEQLVVGGRRLGAGVGDDPCQQRADEERHPQDGRVAEQIDQERPHGSRPVRAAQVEQHDGKAGLLHGNRGGGGQGGVKHGAPAPSAVRRAPAAFPARCRDRD